MSARIVSLVVLVGLVALFDAAQANQQKCVWIDEKTTLGIQIPLGELFPDRDWQADPEFMKRLVSFEAKATGSTKSSARSLIKEVKDVTSLPQANNMPLAKMEVIGASMGNNFAVNASHAVTTFWQLDDWKSVCGDQPLGECDAQVSIHTKIPSKFHNNLGLAIVVLPGTRYGLENQKWEPLEAKMFNCTSKKDCPYLREQSDEDRCIFPFEAPDGSIRYDCIADSEMWCFFDENNIALGDCQAGARAKVIGKDITREEYERLSGRSYCLTKRSGSQLVPCLPSIPGTNCTPTKDYSNAFVQTCSGRRGRSCSSASYWSGR